MNLVVPSIPAATNRPSSVLCAVAAHGLDRPAAESQTTGSPASPPLSQTDWHVLLSMARHQRLLGLLACAVADGAVPASVEQADELHRAHLEDLCRDLICERQLIEIVRTLRHAALDHRVLKGPSVAHLDYPDPALRSFADVDLLVRADQWDDAIAVLAEAGWQRQFGEPRPGFDRRFVKGVVLIRTEGGTRTELDLHRTLALGPFGLTVRLADLWDRHDVLQLGGEKLDCLGAEERFLHACFHAVLGDFPPRLVPLRDIAEMSLNEDLDLEFAIDLSRSWQAQAVLLRAVQLSWATLNLNCAAEPWVRVNLLEPPRRELKALAPYLSTERSYVGLCLAATRAIPKPADKARYLAAMAFPKRQFLAPRYPTRVARWRAAAQALRPGRASTSVGNGYRPR